MNDADRRLCIAMAGLLRASSIIAIWGVGLAFVAALVLALAGRSLSLSGWGTYGAVALIGLLERYLALRIALDATLFESLARGTIPSLSALDTVLERIGLRGSADPSRLLPARVRGARGLVQRHGLAVASQTVIFAIALAVQKLAGSSAF